jgi:hypothetical protein
MMCTKSAALTLAKIHGVNVIGILQHDEMRSSQLRNLNLPQLDSGEVTEIASTENLFLGSFLGLILRISL